MLGWVAAFILLGYLVPHFLVSLLPSQNLKTKARVFVLVCVARFGTHVLLSCS